jgi:hypothetical protein
MDNWNDRCSQVVAWLRKEYPLSWVRKEFSSWAIKALFGLAFGGVVYAFLKMETGSFLLLVFCTFLLLVTGTAIVRQVVREIRKSAAQKKDHARSEELKRRKQIRKLFQDLIDEAEKSDEWTDGQFGSWISQIEHAMRPLMEADVAQFLNLFGHYKGPQILMINPLRTPVAEKRRDWNAIKLRGLLRVEQGLA